MHSDPSLARAWLSEVDADVAGGGHGGEAGAGGGGSGGDAASESGWPFPVVMDPPSGLCELAGGGDLYRAFGLGRTVAGAWLSSAVGLYAEAVARGIALHRAHRQDVLQMGGDFVLRRRAHGWEVVAAFRSVSSTDRAPVHAIVAACAGSGAA